MMYDQDVKTRYGIISVYVAQCDECKKQQAAHGRQGWISAFHFDDEGPLNGKDFCSLKCLTKFSKRAVKAAAAKQLQD